MGFDRIVSATAAVLDDLARHRGRGRADVRGARASVRSSGRRWRRACSRASTCPGSRRPAGSRATDEASGSKFIRRPRRPTTTCCAASRTSSRSPTTSGLTMPQLAIAWVLQNPNVSAALVGATRPEQLEDNVKAAGVTLEPALMTRIDDVLGDASRARPGQDRQPARRPLSDVKRGDLPVTIVTWSWKYLEKTTARTPTRRPCSARPAPASRHRPTPRARRRPPVVARAARGGVEPSCSRGDRTWSTGR